METKMKGDNNHMYNKKRLSFMMMLGLLLSNPAYTFAQEEVPVETQEVQETQEAEAAQDQKDAEQGEATESAKGDESAEDKEEELPEGQRKATIYIVSITGNELTYYEKDKSGKSDKTPDAVSGATGKEGTEKSEGADAVSGATVKEDSESGEEADAVSGATGKERPEGGFGKNSDGREKPQGDFNPKGGKPDAVSGATGKERPEGGFDRNSEGRERPQGDFNPEDFEAGDFKPGDFDGGDFNPGSFKPGENGNNDTTTVYLSVAVEVYSNIGEKKTFSILQEGDEAEALFEKGDDGTEVITQIWLKSTGESI
ncbi:MAG: hypothetical protein HUJ72_00830 [Blautia sp.]|nr:hypothetical protein [Blautia sp.]